MESLQQRVANKIYESCRAGSLEITGFPEFRHLLSAIQNTQPQQGETSYQVTVKRHDRLVVLSSFASKFLELDDLKDAARELIETHNSKFNEGGDWWAEPEQTRTQLLLLFQSIFLSPPPPHNGKICIGEYDLDLLSRTSVPRRNDRDDDGSRPAKRIKLEQSELAAETDIVNLSSPHLEIETIGVHQISSDKLDLNDFGFDLVGKI